MSKEDKKAWEDTAMNPRTKTGQHAPEPKGTHYDENISKKHQDAKKDKGKKD